MPHISVVSPVYKAEGCVQELCLRLKKVLSGITDDYEVILVDDGSPDGSWKIITEESIKDRRIKGIKLARNFGQHRAITAGLDVAKGDWVVVMDCDLQDMPEEIPLLYAKALEGNEIVVAQFEERKESVLQQFTSKIFWNVLSWLAGIQFDYRIGNFRIMSSTVVKNFRRFREQLRLLGGITTLMGFRVAYLPVKRADRFSGETSYSFRKRLSVAIDIAIAYSDKPLKISVFVGLFISALSVLSAIVVSWLAYQGKIVVPGWASVIVSLYFLGGLVIANLGVLGYYVGKTFDETKRRPLYIVGSMTEELLQREEDRTDSSGYLVRKSSGAVNWITGLSGAGKSTLAQELVKRLRQQGKSVIMLDGDELRKVFGSETTTHENYGRNGRLMLAFQYSHLCALLAKQGFTVVIATISLFKEIHKWNRENLPDYFEVYLKVSLSELRRRDPKKIYARFDAGEVRNVAGLDLEVDEPEEADLVVEFNPEKSVDVLVDELMCSLNNRKEIYESSNA